MRWELCDDGFICNLSGQEIGSHDDPCYRIVDADDEEAARLSNLFGTSEPVVCQACQRGQNVSEWLEHRVEEHRDENAKDRAAIHWFFEDMNEYRYYACQEDAQENAPDEFWETGGDCYDKDYEPFDTELAIELTVLKIAHVWMNLGLLSRNAPRSFEPDEERSRQVDGLKKEYRRLLDKLFAYKRLNSVEAS